MIAKASNPLIVIIPGAWHKPSHYHPLITSLQDTHPVLCLKLPTVDAQDPVNTTVLEDVEFIRTTLLLPLVNAGFEILLFMHSYGGVPGNSAASGLSIRERKEKGLEGGIIGLVHFAAILANKDQSLLHAVGGKHPPWVQDKGDIMMPSSPETVFYGDLSTGSELLAASISNLGTHSKNAQERPILSSAWSEPFYNSSPTSGSTPALPCARVYIKPTDDRALPAFVQEIMLKNTGMEWTVKEMADGQHCGMIAQPDKVAMMIKEILNELA